VMNAFTFNGSLYEMPTLIGKKLGDMTPGEVMEEARLCVRLVGLYSIGAEIPPALNALLDADRLARKLVQMDKQHNKVLAVWNRASVSRTDRDVQKLVRMEKQYNKVAAAWNRASVSRTK